MTRRAPSSTENAAADYAEAGVPVFPVRLPDKMPLWSTPKGTTPDGFWLVGTTDLVRIRRWGRRWEGAGIGTPTGRGRGVLDIDVKSGAVIDRRWPSDTLRVRTPSGGEHWWFSYSGFIPTSQDGAGGRLGDFVDFRGDKGMALLPGSPGYEWINDLPIRPLPAWMAEAARTPPRRTGHASGEARGRFEFLEQVREGGRNGYLASAAGAFLRRGVESDELEDVLQEHNRRVCWPPLDEEEVSRIAASIGRYDVSNVSIHPKGVGYLDSSQRRSRPRRRRAH
jgi:putative DNA primase/helicase